MNADDHDAVPPAPRGSDADAEDADNFVTVTESEVTRATFRHAPLALGDVPLLFDVVVTLDNRIVIEGVQIRALFPRGFEIVWPGLVNATIDGVAREAYVASRARRRIGKRLVKLLVESDLGAELP